MVPVRRGACCGGCAMRAVVRADRAPGPGRGKGRRGWLSPFHGPLACARGVLASIRKSALSLRRRHPSEL